MKNLVYAQPSIIQKTVHHIANDSYSMTHTVTYLHYKRVHHLDDHMWYTVNGEITIYGIPHMVIFCARVGKKNISITQ